MSGMDFFYDLQRVYSANCKNVPQNLCLYFCKTLADFSIRFFHRHLVENLQ